MKAIANPHIKRFLKYGPSKKSFINDDPRCFHSTLKNTVILPIIALASMIPGFAMSDYYPNIGNDLHASIISTKLGAALFILFMGIGPLFWGTVSESYLSRRFAFRASPTYVIAGCIITDIYPLEQRGKAGPPIGPVIGGFLVTDWNWRAVF
ncbi:hypothetical protein BDB00DRAFT_876487 [Zychaea mexicana]|uniref:uncharacterized protein n=1 Tax=Zychaea mexicana TaxID=64656 RepID=UPI0022FF032B|nr:uncharacterized protein BDB00DRAFT_876487 [Zychaea mexicana]KAI9489288.1 hypothetical protein BDB00DRAFT_876487 [Zychaea mexicana]